MSSKSKKQTALRAALRNKKTLRTYFDLATAESADVEKAQRRVDVARQLVAATLLHKDAEVVAKAEQALEEAEAGLAACFHRIWFRGLGLTRFDDLVAEHPPTDAQTKDGWLWNPDTFNFELLAACALDSDLTADEWREELADEDRWSRADRNRIIEVCLAANRQTMSDALPKG